MNLIERCQGARAWHAIFNDYEMPAEINMLYCHLVGNLITFRFESPMVDRAYPARWEQQHNCFGFDLGFVDAADITVSGLNFYGKTQIYACANPRLTIKMQTHNCTIEFSSPMAYLSNISGYYNELL
ncbi:hypothetical protein [Pseudomonas xanthosomatis]|uniref:hypothetical protein n=1 Tax=Pseudomonas xanthosomatis TaxID=2842356 RepID=UPI00351990CE